jgi:SsrA-binding protein
VAEKSERAIKVVAENRKARFNYSIEDTVEAGLALTGTEVKSIRNGKITIAESYADSRDGEIWLINANIPEYLQANRFNHEPKRPRKLLLHRKQINKLMGADSLEALFQRTRPRQASACRRQGQEAARQAREREEARLEARERPAAAGEGIA